MNINHNSVHGKNLLRIPLICSVFLLLGVFAVPAASQADDPTPTLSPETTATLDAVTSEPVVTLDTATPDPVVTLDTATPDPAVTPDTPTAPVIEETPDSPLATPTPTPSFEIQGKALYQNRVGDILIEITVRDSADNVLGSTLTDSDGNYTLAVQAGDSYWLNADAPLHRPTQIQIIPGSEIPQIVLLGGDLNDNGCVGVSDLAILVGEPDPEESYESDTTGDEGTDGSDPAIPVEEPDLEEPSQSDITGDGITDGSDLAILAANFELDCELPVEPEETLTPTPTESETPTETPTETSTGTPEDSVSTPTPSIEPSLVTALPFYDSFSDDQNWLPSGVWQFDTQTAYNETGWFADSTARGQSSTLEYAGWFALSGLDHLTLTFWQGSLLADVDVVAVEVSLDSGATWIAVDQQVGLRTDWAMRTIDLEPYRDQIIKLRFQIDTTAELATETSTLGYWLDDLAIDQTQPLATATPDTTATATPTADGLTATPDGTITVTPTADGLTATPDGTATATPTADGLTATPDSTITATPFVIDLTATPEIAPTETGTITPTPTPLTLPVYETLDSEAGWLVQGAWRIDAQSDTQRVSWFADSSARGQSSTLTYLHAVRLETVFNPVISFWQKTRLAPGDVMAFDLSQDAGLTWSTLLQQSDLSADWTQYEIDLSPYRGQIVWLRFRVDTISELPEGLTSTGCWFDELGIYEVQPVPTPSLPASTPTPTATLVPTVTETPLPSPTPTTTPSPTMTETPPPSLTPTAIPSFTPVVETAPLDGAAQEDTSTPENG